MAELSGRGRYYEEFAVGDRLSSPGRTVSEATIDLFGGITGDLSHVHMDDAAMKETEFGGRIGHGILSLALLQGLMWQSGYSHGTAVATVGWDKLKFPLPLRIGDTVRAQWTVAAMRESRSRPEMGIVVEDCRLVNQRGETVLTGEHAMLIRRRPLA